MVQMKFQRRLLENSLLLRKAGLFVPFRPSVDRVRPTHVTEGNLLYSRPPASMFVSPRSTLMEMPRRLDYLGTPRPSQAGTLN